MHGWEDQKKEIIEVPTSSSVHNLRQSERLESIWSTPLDKRMFACVWTICVDLQIRRKRPVAA